MLSTNASRSLLGAALLAVLLVLPGGFFALMGLGVIAPEPGSLHVPGWAIGVCGLVFLCAGLSLLIAALARVGRAGPPRPTSLAFHATRYLAGLVTTAILAGSATWVVLYTGGAGPVRPVFAAGAVLCWMLLIFQAARGWRDLRNTRRPQIHIDDV